MHKSAELAFDAAQVYKTVYGDTFGELEGDVQGGTITLHDADGDETGQETWLTFDGAVLQMIADAQEGIDLDAVKAAGGATGQNVDHFATKADDGLVLYFTEDEDQILYVPIKLPDGTVEIKEVTNVYLGSEDDDNLLFGEGSSLFGGNDGYTLIIGDATQGSLIEAGDDDTLLLCKTPANDNFNLRFMRAAA